MDEEILKDLILNCVFDKDKAPPEQKLLQIMFEKLVLSLIDSKEF